MASRTLFPGVRGTVGPVHQCRPHGVERLRECALDPVDRSVRWEPARACGGLCCGRLWVGSVVLSPSSEVSLSLALTASSLLLSKLILLHSDTPIYYYWLETSMVAVGYSTVGAIVASRLPESPIGWLFCAIGLIFGISHFSAEYAAYDLLAPSRSLPGGGAFAWLTSWVWVGGLGLIVFLDLLFPNGRLPSARWRWFARLSALLTLVGAVLAAFSPGPIVLGLPGIRNPLGIEDLPNAYKPVQVLMLVLI